MGYQCIQGKDLATRLQLQAPFVYFKRQRQRFSICYFIPHTVTIAVTGLGDEIKNLEPNILWAL